MTNHHSEAEAKAKWCPFARATTLVEDEEVGIAAAIAANRTPDGYPDIGAPCLASGCMAWRWEFAPLDLDQTNWRGYCGLTAR